MDGSHLRVFLTSEWSDEVAVVVDVCFFIGQEMSLDDIIKANREKSKPSAQPKRPQAPKGPGANKAPKIVPKKANKVRPWAYLIQITFLKRLPCIASVLDPFTFIYILQGTFSSQYVFIRWACASAFLACMHACTHDGISFVCDYGCFADVLLLLYFTDQQNAPKQVTKAAPVKQGVAGKRQVGVSYVEWSMNEGVKPLTS